MNATTTTYPKAKLAEIKKRGAVHIATDLLIDMKMSTDAYEMSLIRATSAAKSKVNTFDTRQLYQFLKDSGYTFNTARAIWQAHS